MNFNIADADVERLAFNIRTINLLAPKSRDRAWVRCPAIKVIDCVMSLNRDYDHFVVPKLDKFEQNYPEVRTVHELKKLMQSFPSVKDFVATSLGIKDPRRAATLEGVVAWMCGVGGQGTPEEQCARLHNWALTANPADYSYLGIPGFGLAGFQYMRMLFGANTTKPDKSIRRFVEQATKRKASNIFALKMLEHAAQRADVDLRNVDSKIFQSIK
jgi:hypothetical protein